MANIKEILDTLVRLQKPVSRIHINKEKNSSPTDLNSHFFGLPFWPTSKEEHLLELSEHELYFVAQLNLSEVKIQGFPHSGVLQIFSLCGDDAFFEDDPCSAQEDINPAVPQHRIVYHSQKDIDSGLLPDTHKLYRKVLKVMKANAQYPQYNLTFVEGLDPPNFQSFNTIEMSQEDIDFFHHHEFDYEEHYSTDQILTLSALVGEKPEYVLMATLVNTFSSKIGGYPNFTQYDPRSEETNVTQHLLQMSSCDDFMFGDMGDIHFFINPQDIPDLLAGKIILSMADYQCY